MLILDIFGSLFLLSVFLLALYEVLVAVFHIGPFISTVISSWMKVHLALAIALETLVMAGLFILGIHFLGVFG